MKLSKKEEEKKKKGVLEAGDSISLD